MIIGVVGRIAAGKGVIADLLKEKGFEYVKISQALHDEAKRLGIPSERKALQDLGNSLREREGGGALAKRLVGGLSEDKNYIIDGIRNHHEVLELKKAKNFFLISVDAPREIRFQRVLSRNKEYDVKTWDEFVMVDDRDFSEKDKNGKVVDLGQQVGKCMDLADFHLVNDGDFEEFREEVAEVIAEIEGKVNH